MTLKYGTNVKNKHPSELSAAAAVTTYTNYIEENQPQTQSQEPPSLEDLIEHQETENNQDETVTADPKDVKYKYVRRESGGFYYTFTNNKNNYFSSHGKLHVFSIILSFIYFKVVLSLVQYHH